MNIISFFVCFALLGAVPVVRADEVRNVHSFVMPDIDGKNVELSSFKGKVLLIVNTASQCGFTKQYAGLEKLYETYKERGLVVLAFPANDFLGQEPGTNDQIKAFCALKFKASFPLFAKSSVKGSDINPLYKYLTQDSPFSGVITWNFNKFLVDADGNVVARFDTKTDPMAPEVISKVESVLPKRN